jgi:hypothetical protein
LFLLVAAVAVLEVHPLLLVVLAAVQMAMAPVALVLETPHLQAHRKEIMVVLVALELNLLEVVEVLAV